MHSRLTLVGLDIEGAWNVPLLRNAAEMSGASVLFARTDDAAPPLEDTLAEFDATIACEAVRHSRSVYEYAAPRGRLAVIVGNELSGLPKRVLKTADQIVSIPMFGRGMSSVNVAVAGAIVLYALERDLARKRFRPSSLSPRDVDVLIAGPPDPSELGSLLRSTWAFGWQRVFLEDRHGVWFTTDRSTVLAGRAAARREVNPLVIVPREQMNLADYRRVIVCDGQRDGTPLSRFSLPDQGKVLLVLHHSPAFELGGWGRVCEPPAIQIPGVDGALGLDEGDLQSEFAAVTDRVYVDHCITDALPAFRHSGSILLSVVSQLVRRGSRG